MSSQGFSPLRILVLGGSSEATALVRALGERPGVAITVSLAGRTQRPAVQAVATRVGGFGGVDGLVRTIRERRTDILVDATHPFAQQMSAHARQAAELALCSLIRLSRPPWTAGPGDLWTEVASAEDAATAIGAAPKRVFLTLGRLQLKAFRTAPSHHYLVRTIDAVGCDHGFMRAEFLQARGPFDVDAEARLMQDHQIDVLVTKNSGGTAAVAKLVAARRLQIPVILIKPPPEEGPVLGVDEAMAAIDAHIAHARRGV